MPQVSKSENLQEVGRKIRHYREKKKICKYGFPIKSRTQGFRERTQKTGKRICRSGSIACTVKKSKCALGGVRGRMISASDRKTAVELIE